MTYGTVEDPLLHARSTLSRYLTLKATYRLKFSSRMEESRKPVIVIVTGPYKGGKNKFLSAYDPAYESKWFPLKPEVIESKWPDDPTHDLVFIRVPSSVLNLGSAVSQQIAQVNAYQTSYSREDEFGGILFMQGTTDNNLDLDRFTNGSKFLGLSENELRQRCIIVRTFGSKDNSKRMDNIRMDHFAGTQDSARTIIRTLLGEAHSLPRSLDQAVILLVGQSGHGKSKTVNRLVGHPLLAVGKPTAGSTTKGIQRVTVNVREEDNTDSRLSKTVAFDDTPGYEDTTYSDREENAWLMGEYKRKYFSDQSLNRSSFQSGADIFPNVILLIAEWKSVTPDVHNSPNFTSSAGKSMLNLRDSGLVDLRRNNVVIVITKSLSSWNEYDDYKLDEDKEILWRHEASRRRSMIIDLQQTIFYDSQDPWPIVFIENGSSDDMDPNYIKLPNGELSHRNLFEAISHERVIFGNPKTELLIPARALPAVEGQTSGQTLIRKSGGTPKDIVVDKFLGVAYNPKTGKFGSTCVLDMQGASVKTFPRGRSSEINLQSVAGNKQLSKARLGIDPSASIIELSNCYPGPSPKVMSETTTQYVVQHITAVTKIIKPLSPSLSAEMIREIAKLPLLSDDELDDSSPAYTAYSALFDKHGTHVVLGVALGGRIGVFENGTHQDGKEGKKEVAGKPTFFCDGGQAMEPQLKQYFLSCNQRPSLPAEVRVNWIEALDTDPAFCPDAEDTLYAWMYDLQGLTPDQRRNLRRASILYLQKDSANQENPQPRRFIHKFAIFRPVLKMLKAVVGQFKRRKWGTECEP
ncbi:hypothetical protein K435DRAFT_931676 [Dendrothele bispora CBS 962.96]|uniref:MACPF domain-containing protein n=1 Tax=Dendrothele bispora (strain CBS 962.96) TaxID=1314807 RepID=A0A4S8ME08_DENBC|nr:hypothetical protein K435DRAFT_931676 [Dendrothele bispora CBS 962.96]